MIKNIYELGLYRPILSVKKSIKHCPKLVKGIGLLKNDKAS